jgi:hypothetical protein
MFAYISRYVRVYLDEKQCQFLSNHREQSSFLQSSLTPEELPIAKILADKCVLVRKKLDNDTQYALNKSIRFVNK